MALLGMAGEEEGSEEKKPGGSVRGAQFVKKKQSHEVGGCGGVPVH